MKYKLYFSVDASYIPVSYIQISKIEDIIDTRMWGINEESKEEI